MTKVPKNIDDLIGAWHAAPDTETRELHEYLGWTLDEYKAWFNNRIAHDGTILTDCGDCRRAAHDLIACLNCPGRPRSQPTG